MDKFIKLLDDLGNIVTNSDLDTELGALWLHDIPETKQPPGFAKLLNEIEGWCDTGLIKPDGQADFRAHRLLTTLSNGKYKVVKGESDSFGWLCLSVCG